MKPNTIKNIDVIVIANLEHASPRIPGLSQYMCSLNDRVRVITPIPGQDFKERWAINGLDEKQFQIIDAPYSGDILQIVRRLLWRFGLANNVSLTEQLKSESNSEDRSKFWSKFKRKLPEWLLYRYQEFFGIPDLEITWYKSASRKAGIEVKKKRPDFIISSSPYMTSHLVASRVAKKYNIPWVADFRDTWSNNPAYPFSNLRRVLDKYLEKRIISRADLITTVSEAYGENLKKIHKGKIKVIPNGYTRLSPLVNPVVNASVLNIVYTGTIYEGFQNFPIFLKAVKKALEKGLIDKKLLRIDFYGRYIFGLQEIIEDFDLSACVFQNGFVSREDAFDAQRRADLLLFFNWEGIEAGLSHLKLYEYLGSMRPIFVVGSRIDVSNQKIVEETNSGYVGIGSDEICNLLVELYNKNLKEGGVPYKPNMTVIKKNSYYERGKFLRNLLISM